MLGVTLVVFIVSIAAVIAARHNFAGTWKTTWGDLVLTQEGDAVRGNYGSGEKAGSIRGAVSGPRLSFSWREGRKRGRGYFDMVYDGKNVLIEGRWGNGDSDTNGGAWKGHKEGGTFENTTQGAALEAGVALRDVEMHPLPAAEYRPPHAGEQVDGDHGELRRAQQRDVHQCVEWRAL